MPFGSYSPQRTSSFTIPASVGGVNAVQALSLMRPEECIYSFNMLPGDGGQQVRNGYREVANGWTGGAARTVIPFQGNARADDKLFVANNTGIWDVTTVGETAPTQVVTFGVTTGNAGICAVENFTNDGNARFLLVCDGANGYYRWAQSTNTWTKITAGTGANQISGVDPATFDYVMTWKNRVWFIESGSANAWYLDTAAFEGKVTKFNFGTQFKSGGALRSLHNWTLDGGDGLDDQLVVISGAGDVLIYGGTDPDSAATFSLVGSWFIGELPAGNRIAKEFAGELYILSIQGVLPISTVQNKSGILNPDSYISAGIAPYIRAVVDTTVDDFGWQIYDDAKKSQMVISSPVRASYDRLGFVMYFGTGAWGMTRSVPAGHTANWAGEVYFTDIAENRLWKYSDYIDQVYLDVVTDGDPVGITWDILTAYQPMEFSANYKRVQYIRPMFSAVGVPSFSVRAQYDFDVSEITGAPAFGGAGTGVWNAGIWNQSLWAGGLDASDSPRGGKGMGRHIAVNIRGISAEQTTLIGFDVPYDMGGLM